MSQAAALRIAATFSLLALALAVLAVALTIVQSGAGAQDPLETFSSPAVFTSILQRADPALRNALFVDGLFAIAYTGAVGFAAFGFRANCQPAAWAAGLGMIATLALDISENLLMLGSLGLAGTGEEVEGARVALHAFVSGMKLHVAAFALVAFSFVVPRQGFVTFMMRWGSRTLMPVAAILFVTDAFGLSAAASLGVFVAMVGGFALLPVAALREARAGQ